ncbi:YdiU family protein [Mycoplasmatota bacterium zrk1]
MNNILNQSETGWNLENSYLSLPNLMYTRIEPQPVTMPKLELLNEKLADALGMEIDYLKSIDGVNILAGNKVPDSSNPIAQAYAGHQFGHFTMLGDGRALLIGEQVTPDGERFDIQLKGSGRTPYSRRGDGRATLGSMLREYIISEAMYGLGIPTTRSLSVVSSGETVIREVEHVGAILTRVAQNHIRVGTFEYVATKGSFEELRSLADYTINRYYPEVECYENKYLHFLNEVIKNQTSLIAKWQSVGFIHGVMNTDNMTISGETIDYGPCAFMDVYNPKTVFSSIDRDGRYAYMNQPNIGAWNLARFAETLLPLIDDNIDKAVKLATVEITKFNELYCTNWLDQMRAKLGLFNEEEQDKELIEKLLSIMDEHKADYTNTFRSLTLLEFGDLELTTFKEFKEWYILWEKRLNRQDESKANSKQLMKKSNPSIIPRNYLVEEAIDAVVKHNDYNLVKKFVTTLSNPYSYSEEQDEYAIEPVPSIVGYKTYCGT